ncbi:MAG: hypothetical protein H0X31_02870 [Nostocaceae cyanobacterium]|nr:hypothetical protein [Nostocaceae cyanobacterium]
MEVATVGDEFGVTAVEGVDSTEAAGVEASAVASVTAAGVEAGAVASVAVAGFESGAVDWD